MCISESKNDQCLTSYTINKYQNLTNANLKHDKDKLNTIEFIMKLNYIDHAKTINILEGNEWLGLNNHGIYIDNVDVTIDCGFTFDTDTLIDEFSKQFDFHYEG